jgi:hypothetical protein
MSLIPLIHLVWVSAVFLDGEWICMFVGVFHGTLISALITGGFQVFHAIVGFRLRVRSRFHLFNVK